MVTSVYPWISRLLHLDRAEGSRVECIGACDNWVPHGVRHHPVMCGVGTAREHMLRSHCKGGKREINIWGKITQLVYVSKKKSQNFVPCNNSALSPVHLCLCVDLLSE